MIDNFSLLVSHGLLALLFWRLLSRPDLDKEPPAGAPKAEDGGASEPRPGWRRPPAGGARAGKQPKGRADA